ATCAALPPPALAEDCTSTAPANGCILGGGTSRLDCLQEWLVVPKTQRNYKGIPRNKLVCVGGDPHCEPHPDPTNGMCVFSPKICINNQDPRLSNCTPSDVSTFEFDAPDKGSTTTFDELNRNAIEYELGYGGLGPYIVQDRKLVFAGVVNDTPN